MYEDAFRQRSPGFAASLGPRKRRAITATSTRSCKPIETASAVEHITVVVSLGTDGAKPQD